MAGKMKRRLEGEARVLDFLKERVQDERDDYEVLKGRRQSLAMARERVFLDELKGVLKDALGGGVAVPSGYAKKSLDTGPKKRIVNIALSDLHYHSLLDPR